MLLIIIVILFYSQVTSQALVARLELAMHTHAPIESTQQTGSLEELVKSLILTMKDSRTQLGHAELDLAASKAEKESQELLFLAQINALRRQGTEKDEEHKEQILQITSDLAAAMQAHEAVLNKERLASSEAVKTAQRLLDKDREVFVLTTAAEANRCETQALRTQIADMTRQFQNVNDTHAAQTKTQSDEYALLLNKFNELTQTKAAIEQRGKYVAMYCGIHNHFHSPFILFLTLNPTWSQ